MRSAAAALRSPFCYCEGPLTSGGCCALAATERAATSRSSSNRCWSTRTPPGSSRQQATAAGSSSRQQQRAAAAAASAGHVLQSRSSSSSSSSSSSKMSSGSAGLSHKRLNASVEGPLGAPRSSDFSGDEGTTATGHPGISSSKRTPHSSSSTSSSGSSTACSSSSSSISSGASPRLGSELAFSLSAAGDARSPACLFADTPAVSPRPSAAEVRREEERSERQVNASRHRQQLHQETGLPPASGTKDRGASQGASDPWSSQGGPGAGQDPPHAPLYNAKCLQRVSSGSVDEWISRLLHGEALKADEIKQLCRLLAALLETEPNCLRVSSPITIAGDIHGQFYDLLELFRIGGLPPQVSYLFMGDYVDRGFYSIEVFCLIAALKIRFPYAIAAAAVLAADAAAVAAAAAARACLGGSPPLRFVVAVLRGNHESRSITEVYGFYDECLRKRQEPPPDGGMSELLWSDPFDAAPGEAGGDDPAQAEGETEGLLSAAPTLDAEGWAPSSRGAGLLWGKDVTDRFLHLNNMQCVCRAHQLVSDGYQW
ncbi:hypothetical protein ACSSS7_006727 [Eimeria intestinalis]